MTNTNVRNVFILTVDSLSYHHYADHAKSIANKIGATNFRNAIAPASNTRCSAPALHAGIFADSELLDGPEIHISPTGPPKTVAEQFRNAGYETGFWTPNHIFGNSNNYNKGFDHGDKGKRQWNKRIADLLKDRGTEWMFDLGQTVYFYGLKPILGGLQDRDGYVWGPAEKIQPKVLRWFEENEPSSVFCWIHYMDTHHPFEPPQEYLDDISLNHNWDRKELSFFTRDAIKSNAEGLTADEIEDVKKAYQAACDYLCDQQLAFIDELVNKKHFKPEKDILCLTSDHGEAFNPGKHHLMGHASFFEEIVRVPLIINHPRWSDRNVDDQVSLIDVMPSILTATDLPVPETFEGRSCMTPSELTKDFVYAIDGNPTRRMIRGNGKKLFAHWLGDDEFEIICTRYECGSALDEEIVLRLNYDEFERSGPSILPNEYVRLNSLLQRDHGEALKKDIF